MRRLKVLGTNIIVYKKKVKIYDPKDQISDNHAILILEYLHHEGFIETEGDISCEIINEDE